MAKRFIISDTHFNHDNIRLYESRPFDNKEDMNYYMIDKWNSVVSEQDTVFHLGDFAFANKEITKEFIRQLNGKIYLIMGNHDRSHTESWWLDAGIKKVSKYPIIIDEHFMLSHEPLYLNEHMPYINFHGHLHSQCYNNPQYINCSVENHDYTPQNLDKIIEMFNPDEV